MAADLAYDKLIAAAYRFLSYRPRSEKELRDFCDKTLRRHHTTAPLVIKRVLERCTELGYVDDKKFVEWWVHQRTTFKPKGIRVIISELRAKGIARDAVEAYVASSTSSSGERELAKRAISKKLVLWQPLPLLKRKQKIVEFLLRRGFDSEVSFGVVDELLAKE